MDANNYEEYLEKYSGTSNGRSYFIAVCGFFELSGVLVSYGLIDQNIYFDMFNPTPFWEKAKPIVEGMRNKRPHIYEKFELLNNKRLSWTKKRNGRSKDKLQLSYFLDIRYSIKLIKMKGLFESKLRVTFDSK